MKKVTFFSIIASVLVVLVGITIVLWTSPAQTQSIMSPQSQVNLSGLVKHSFSGKIRRLDPDNRIFLNGNDFPETKRPVALFEWNEYCQANIANNANIAKLKESTMRRAIFGVLSSTDKYFEYIDGHQLEKDIQADVISRYNMQSEITRCQVVDFTRFEFELSK